jgi:hypothetical protein
MRRRELRFTIPAAAFMGAAVLAVAPLYGRSIWLEIGEALAAGAFVAAVLWILELRRQWRQMQNAAELRPEAVRETAGRTVRREVIQIIAIAALLALLLPTFQGDTGALAGLLLAGAVVNWFSLRQVARWERANNAVLWRERKLRWKEQLVKESQRSLPGST